MTVVAGIDATRISDIAREVAPHVRHTPLIPTPGGGMLKLESLQPTGSFKVRGFFAAAHAIDRERVARGLITISAGNAALACAYVARSLHVPCRVLMFDNAPALKINGVRDLGAEAVLLPRERILEWMATRAWEHEPEVFIHPFADESVILGHGSIVPEIIADLPDVERVIVPVGGGRTDLRHRARVCCAEARRAGDGCAVGRISLVASGVCGQWAAWARARHDRRRDLSSI